jgi:hypothetical protein
MIMWSERLGFDRPRGIWRVWVWIYRRVSIKSLLPILSTSSHLSSLPTLLTEVSQRSPGSTLVIVVPLSLPRNMSLMPLGPTSVMTTPPTALSMRTAAQSKVHSALATSVLASRRWPTPYSIARSTKRIGWRRSLEGSTRTTGTT